MRHLLPITLLLILSLSLTPQTLGGEDGLITVDFQNTDINQAIKVLGDLTGNIIIPHKDLKGTLTVISLQKVKPEVVINILKSALSVRGFTLVKSGDVLKVVPLPETKQTNVAVRIGASPQSIKDEDTVITQVIPLRYSSAIKLKTGLQPLVGKHGNIIAEGRSNLLIITDASSNIKRLALIIAEMEKPSTAKAQVKTFILNYGNAETVAGILEKLSQDDDKITPLPQSLGLAAKDAPLEIFGKIQALPDIGTNSIVVSSPAVNFPTIERLIEELDMFPPQAMIEVVAMDVILDDDFSMGVELSSATAPTSTTDGVSVDTTGNNTKESIFHSFLNFAADAATKGFTYRLFDPDEALNILAFILNTQENSKILSTPKILASNNQESTITVGQEIPIIESSVTDIVNNVTTVNIKYEDIGMSLKVTPRISQDNYVNLVIHAEFKDLSPQTLFDASVINKREADATVMIPDGYTVVLGGLIRDRDSIIESKIPILGDIPFIGTLFKKTETDLLKTELIIFLTPHVIKNAKDLERVTSESAQKLTDTTSSSGPKEAVKKVFLSKDKTKKVKKENKAPGLTKENPPFTMGVR